MKRKSLSKKKRFEVFKRDKFTCQYCGKNAPDVVLEVDHIRPVSKGGNNDILNLITSCFDCNRGKSNRELDDSTAINKQVDQLKVLQERRDQINMMLQWKMDLENESDMQIEFIDERIFELTNYHLNDEEKRNMRSWLNKYNLDIILSSIKDALKYLKRGSEENSVTQNSWDIFVKKIQSISYVKSQIKENPVWEDVYKIRYIVDKELNLVSGHEKGRVKDLLFNAFNSGVSTQVVKDHARNCLNLNVFEEEISREISRVNQ